MLNDADRELEVMKTKGEISSDWRDLEQVQRRGEVGGESSLGASWCGLPR